MVNYFTFIVAICRRISLNNLTFLPTTLQMFYPDELDQIFCGSSRQSYARWEVTNLNEACKPDHGYNTESRSVTSLVPPICLAQWLYSLVLNI